MYVELLRQRVGSTADGIRRFMALSKDVPDSGHDAQAQRLGDLDLRQVWQALSRKRKWVLLPTGVVLVLALVAVNLITPRYKSEARILIDGRENVFLRPNGERTEERATLDEAAVASQVQLLLSRDLALEVIKKNKLDRLPEFDPVLNGISPLRSLLALVGIGRDPFTLTPEERVLGAYYDRLAAYAAEKSHVMVVEFQSRDPELAAKVANSIAEGYLVMQQAARRQQAKAAGQWLAGEIDGLRKKVAEAEGRVEAFRSQSNLFVGTNNTPLSGQQLGELNTQLNTVRAQKADAEARSRTIREMLQKGASIEVSDILNTDLMRRLGEQRATLRAQLAEQSSTLLDLHPRIKELKAQIADIDAQMREEAAKVSRSLDNDVRVASARMDSMNASLDQLKKQATSSNNQDVELRALEREAKAQRDLLETYLAKYREATTRETIDAAPSDGRIISGAIVSNTPAYPKKLPIVLIATLITVLLTSGYITTTELLRMTAAWNEPVPPQQSSTEDNEPVPPKPTRHVETPGAAMERLVSNLKETGAHKVTVVGTGETGNVRLTSLVLARLLSRGGRTVLVDLSVAPSVAPDEETPSPGLADLARGAASFGQVIAKDTLSGLHIVSAGAEPDLALLQSPRVAMALDALLQTYECVVLNAGTAAGLPPALIASGAHAVLLPPPNLSETARETLRKQLQGSGFDAVTIMEAAPVDPAPPAGEEVVAA